MATDFSNVSESDIFGPIYNDHIRTISLTSDYRLQDNFGGTNYLTVNWRQGLDILGASHKSDDFALARRRLAKILGAEFLVHALPDPHRRMVGQDRVARPDRVGPDVPVAAILSRRPRLRPRLWRGRDQRRQRHGRLARTALRSEAEFQLLTGYPALRLRRQRRRLVRRLSLPDGLALTSAGGGVRFFLGGDLQADLGVAVPLGYRAPDNPRATSACCSRCRTR